MKGLISSGCVFAGSASYGAITPSALPARAPGELDIHHIDTGRGNSTLVVSPGGETILIDAGSSFASLETSCAPRPDGTRQPGEWIARYAQRHGATSHLDYAVLTHVHPDHVGDFNDALPLAASGGYRLTGISDVDHLLPITTIIDRGYPKYEGGAPSSASYAHNYLDFLDTRVASRRFVASAQVGATDQIKLTHFASLQILAAGGNVWRQAKAVSRVGARINENNLSVAMRLTYGRFSYYTGGDLTADTFDGTAPEQDVETPVVHAAGRTEVATADHHGYFDACGAEFVRTLDAQTYIIQAWEVGHPGTEQLERMLGAWNGKARHDVFATSMMSANQVINRRFTPLMKSRSGHVVVRVAAGGASFRIFVVSSADEHDTVSGTFGPYFCRA